MKKRIVAHRGASNLARENTLEAFAKAIEIGADMVELDVRQTRDGVLAVFHDAKIENKKISKLAFTEISAIGYGRGFKIPTLEEALSLIAGKIPVQIDIKQAGYENHTAEVAKKYLHPSQFIIISFHAKVLKKIKAAHPEIKLGFSLGGSFRHWYELGQVFWGRKKILSTADEFTVKWQLAALGLLKLIPEGYPITLWTLDNSHVIKKFLNHSRISAITSNRPGLAMELREAYGSQPR